MGHTATSDHRPRTVVLLQYTGIGDLVWHIQYFKAVAQHSHGGRVTVVAQPSTLARAFISHEPWVEAVIDHDARAPASADGHSELNPLALSDREKQELVAFLETLSGPPEQ